ncbi:hypothetical protein HanOQP8_Chr16g0607781 [Helianthus annuus]|nr:hypothetical protein HanLR1_Chr16g0611531 [Helianthus annuus]KAJ0644070.1 hypothetical protein HanOQP8_Chr16g0607781 [Helianthus annuus]
MLRGIYTIVKRSDECLESLRPPVFIAMDYNSGQCSKHRYFGIFFYYNCFGPHFCHCWFIFH